MSVRKPDPRVESQYLHGNIVRCACGRVTLHSIHNGICDECFIGNTPPGLRKPKKEVRLKHGHCFDCLKKKASIDDEFPVKFTITLPKIGDIIQCEACCVNEYHEVKKSFPPWVLIELEKTL